MKIAFAMNAQENSDAIKASIEHLNKKVHHTPLRWPWM